MKCSVSIDIALKEQLKHVLGCCYDEIVKYQHQMKQERYTDSLSSDVITSDMRNEFNSDHLKLHLVISTDGGSFNPTSKTSVWPLQAMILDLPPFLRQKSDLILVLSLWVGNTKPKWDVFLHKAICEIESLKSIDFQLQSRTIKVSVEVTVSVCDLPATAAVMNIVQFNGAFGCPKCKSEGQTVPVKSGTTRVYPLSSNDAPMSNSDYERYVEIAEDIERPTFGVKGRTLMSRIVCVPSHIAIDPMHCIFEGIVKALLSAVLNSRNHSFDFYMGRRSSILFLENFLKSTKLPHFVSRFRPLKDMAFWKAHDFRNYFLYLFIPAVCSVQSNMDLVNCFYSLCLLIRMLFVRPLSRELVDDAKVLLNFFSRLFSSVFPHTMRSINVHLLFHVVDDILKFGPLSSISMFPFERNMKHLKSMINGTRSFGTQMAIKSFMRKACLNLCKNSDNKSITMHDSDHVKTKFVNQNKCIINGRIYHSVQHRHQKSCNFLIMFKDSDQHAFGEISRFSESGGCILVHVQPYTCNEKLSSRFLLSQNLSRIFDKYDCFFIMSNKSDPITIESSSVICHCVQMSALIEGQSKTVLTPACTFLDYD